MAQAAKIDGMAAKGETLPALAGVPVGIKDVLVMRGSSGYSWFAHSKGLYASV